MLPLPLALPFALLLSGALPGALPGARQDGGEEPPPDPEVVERVVDALEAALRRGTPDEKVAAIRSAAEVPHADVAEALGDALRDRERDVVAAAVEALRWLDVEAAVEELHAGHAKLRKPLSKDDPELYAALLKAIGQHGHPDSIDVLADGPFESTDRTVLQARILGLGNVRDVRAARELVAMMQKAGKGKTFPAMHDFRLALVHLTGVDRGTARDDWLAWWRDHGDELEVLPEDPAMPEALQRRWSRYWGLEEPRGRREGREERGRGDGGGRDGDGGGGGGGDGRRAG